MKLFLKKSKLLRKKRKIFLQKNKILLPKLEPFFDYTIDATNTYFIRQQNMIIAVNKSDDTVIARMDACDLIDENVGIDEISLINYLNIIHKEV